MEIDLEALDHDDLFHLVGNSPEGSYYGWNEIFRGQMSNERDDNRDEKV